jgi:hypothetical protein
MTKTKWILLGSGIALLITTGIIFRKEIGKLFGIGKPDATVDDKAAEEAPKENPPIEVPPTKPPVIVEPKTVVEQTSTDIEGGKVARRKWAFVVKDGHVARKDAVPVAPVIKIFKKSDRIFIYGLKNGFYQVGFPISKTDRRYLTGYVYPSAVQVVY